MKIRKFLKRKEKAFPIVFPVSRLTEHSHSAQFRPMSRRSHVLSKPVVNRAPTSLWLSMPAARGRTPLLTSPLLSVQMSVLSLSSFQIHMFPSRYFLHFYFQLWRLCSEGKKKGHSRNRNSPHWVLLQFMHFPFWHLSDGLSVFICIFLFPTRPCNM